MPRQSQFAVQSALEEGEAEGQRGGPIITASRQRQYAQDWIFKAC